MNFASGVTWSALTPNCSTIMSLTRCSIVFSAMVFSGSNFCSVSMRRWGMRQARIAQFFSELHHQPAIHGQYLAGNIAGRRPGEEDSGIGDIFRLAETV